MKYMSDREYNARLKEIQAENLTKERKQKLKEEKNKNKKKFKFPSTSKLVLFAVILINFQIVLFVEAAMMKWGNFTACVALVGIPASLVPTIWGYYSKAKAENTAGGIVYDTAMIEAKKKVSDSPSTSTKG